MLLKILLSILSVSTATMPTALESEDEHLVLSDEIASQKSTASYRLYAQCYTKDCPQYVKARDYLESSLLEKRIEEGQFWEYVLSKLRRGEDKEIAEAYPDYEAAVKMLNSAGISRYLPTDNPRISRGLEPKKAQAAITNLEDAARSGIGGAMLLLIDFHNKGRFGVEKDQRLSIEYIISLTRSVGTEQMFEILPLLKKLSEADQAIQETVVECFISVSISIVHHGHCFKGDESTDTKRLRKFSDSHLLMKIAKELNNAILTSQHCPYFHLGGKPACRKNTELVSCFRKEKRREHVPEKTHLTYKWNIDENRCEERSYLSK